MPLDVTALERTVPFFKGLSLSVKSIQNELSNVQSKWYFDFSFQLPHLGFNTKNLSSTQFHCCLNATIYTILNLDEDAFIKPYRKWSEEWHTCVRRMTVHLSNSSWLTAAAAALSANCCAVHSQKKKQPPQLQS